MTELSLTAVRELLTQRRAHMSVSTVPTRDLRLDDEANLLAEGRVLAVGAEARDALARGAQIPSGFFAQCPAHVRAYLFNTLYPEAKRQNRLWPQTALVLWDEATVVGIDDPRLARLRGADVLQAALSAKPGSIAEEQLQVADFHLDGLLQISLVTPQVRAEPRPGDILHAGIDILHSEFGDLGTRISSYISRLVCRNGLIVRICEHDAGSHTRIRRAAVGHPHLTLARVQEMARTAWGELEAKMAVITQLAQEKVDSPAAVIRALGEKLKLPEKLICELVAALGVDELGPSGTVLDMVAAFSRVGTHSDRLSQATSRYLREMSGELIHERLERCPTCGALRKGTMRLFPRR